MNILGINFGHDAAVAFIKDGKLVYAIEEEKLSRVKQDFGWPRHAIDRLLKEQNLKKEDIDCVVFDQEIPQSIGKDEIVYRFTKKTLHKRLEYLNRISSYFNITSRKISENNKQILEQQLEKEGFVNARVAYYDHHLMHAASAYYCSPIACNLIITCDGHGGESAFNFYRMTENGLELIRQNSFRTSVGQFYSCITKLLGFRPNRHEGKITGLAAFGKETELVEKFQSLFYYDNGVLRRFPYGQEEELWEKYDLNNQLGLSGRININTSAYDISLQYAKNAWILLEWLKELTAGATKEDIAYACQKVTEEVILRELEIVKQDYFKSENLIIGLAGGVFANVRVNQKVYEVPGVEAVFVQPAMGDAGLALGGAILADIEYRSENYLERAYVFEHTFWGPDFSKELEEFVNNFDEPEVEMVKMINPSEDVAKLLVKNKIVGFWDGRMEWGPRALGRRSILLNTFNKDANDILNNRLNRTEFMPFAPAVIEEVSQVYFPEYDAHMPAGNFMTITYDTAPEYHEMLQAVVHVDGTARPQIVRPATTPYYYNIIKSFYELSGCGAVVNTSFNAHEEPILSSPETGINALKTNRVDYLVMGPYRFKLKSIVPVSGKVQKLQKAK